MRNIFLTGDEMVKLESRISDRSAQQILLEGLNGWWLSYALQAAAKYNIATLIGDQCKTTAELAKATGTREYWMYQLLSFLAAQGIFAESAPATFENTEISTCLRDDIPHSMRPLALMHGSERLRRSWGALEECMRTGKNATELLYGMDLYTYLDAHPEEGEICDAAMSSVSNLVDEAIASCYDFSHVGRIVDVGGGRGSLLTTLLKRYPAMKGILFDRASVIDRVRAMNKEKGGDNPPYELVAGSFFENVPPDADAYVLKDVLHNWNDEQCQIILQNCSRAMRPSGIILVCERLNVPNSNQGAYARGVSLLMSLQNPGRERTQEEFRALFERVGLSLSRTIPIHLSVWVLEATSKR
jgi:SAM-dependent methyltransferase